MKTGDRFCRCCLLPSCGRSGGSIAKKCRGVPGVTGTLGKTNSHSTQPKRGQEPHHHVEAAVDWCSSSPDISFAPSTLAFSCSWEVLQDLGSDHLPILLSIPLSPVFRPNECPPSFNFQKARWDGFASYFDSHCS